jgi:PAS domain S-box-containing protein
MRDKMNGELALIGKKIKQYSNLPIDGTIQNPTDDSFYRSLHINHNGKHCPEDLYYFLGEYLCTGDETIRNSLITWAHLLGQEAVGTFKTMDLSLHFLFLSRSVIMDLLEEEVRSNRISINTVFDVMKAIDPLIHLVSKTILQHFNDNLMTTKFALYESTEDLRITLRELSGLKRALNEATIFAITDQNDHITYVNDKFCEISKYTKEELHGQDYQILNSGFHPSGYFQDILQTLREGKVWKGEILNKAKDGTKYWVDTTMVPFVDESGNTYKHISIQYDITEKMRTEETLRKTEKLSMVGELAAGIAHEIRNPLTTIKGFVQLLSQSEESKNLLYSDIILEEIDRINFIVSEFMVFAKPQTYYFSECNITEILDSVIKFLEAEAVLKNVIINYDNSFENVFISGEKNQLKQVFLNVIKNGIEAMPNGGVISVSITSSHSEITVTIKDNGIGMSEDQIRKLGEPFFTTKDTGNGLGLMVSYKIIQNHKGNITVHSDMNNGTNFVITFPKF